MSGTAVFQSNTLATPGAGIVVATDAVNGTVYQQIKVDVGPAGTSVLASYAAGTGLPVQGVGTFQALGTVQPLAGSAHIANTAAILGSVSAQGYVAHGAAAAGNPVLISAFGSSGTQVAVSDGQAVRLWSDLNGRLHVRGTIDSIGTIQALGSIQTVGTSQVLGSVQTVGTSQVLGSVQTVGTSQVLGTTQAHGTTYTKEVRANAPTTSSVAATVGNIILLASNANRLGAAVYVESGSALYLKLGSNAGTLDYTVQIMTSGYYEVPFNYSGTISGIWQFTGGTARITEIV